METIKNNIKTPLDYFNVQVKDFPLATAVCCENESLSFIDLDVLSNKLANYILSKEYQPGMPVGILINKSVKTLVTILACWKIGAPYVPIDINAPYKRIKYILETCDIHFSIVDGKKFTDSIDKLFNNTNYILDNIELHDKDKYSNNHWEVILEYSSTPPKIDLSTDSLAYIIFTSGSTGSPKGVMISNRSLSTFIQWCSAFLNIKKKTKALNIANFSFDQSVMDIAFLFGCGIELHLYNSINHPLILADYIQKNEINIISSVPTIFGMLFDDRNNFTPEKFISIKKVFIGGAECPKTYLNLFYEKMPEAEIFNMYGPTEVTVYSLFHKFSCNELREGLTKVPIGKPLPYHKVYMLNEVRKPVINRGELVIEGPQVMEGYWKQKDLSNQAFINNPITGIKGYLTGDIVEQDKDGKLYFIGRNDEMVKIGGNRIDLGEISLVIRKLDAIKDIAVIPIKDNLLENKLIVFVVLKEKVVLSENDIIKACTDSLPRYMLPYKIIFKNELPLNASGKIDKKQLKESIKY